MLIFVENCLLYRVVHDLSVWLRTDSNLQRILTGFEATVENTLPSTVLSDFELESDRIRSTSENMKCFNF